MSLVTVSASFRLRSLCPVLQSSHGDLSGFAQDTQMARFSSLSVAQWQGHEAAIALGRPAQHVFGHRAETWNLQHTYKHPPMCTLAHTHTYTSHLTPYTRTLRISDVEAATPTAQQPRDTFGVDGELFSQGGFVSDDDREDFGEKKLNSLLHGMGEAVTTERTRKVCWYRLWEIGPNADGAMANVSALDVRPAALPGLLLRRLRLRLPLSYRSCPCDHPWPPCSVLYFWGPRKRSAAARACREAGVRVSANVFARDMDLAPLQGVDGRIFEVVADGLPAFQGAQLAIDTTLVPLLRGDGAAYQTLLPGRKGWWQVVRGDTQIWLVPQLPARLAHDVRMPANSAAPTTKKRRGDEILFLFASSNRDRTSVCRIRKTIKDQRGTLSHLSTVSITKNCRPSSNIKHLSDKLLAIGIIKWTVFRDAKPFPFQSANLVETFCFFSDYAHFVFQTTAFSI